MQINRACLPLAQAGSSMAEPKEYGPSKAEMALLGMDIEQLAKQLMKAVKDPSSGKRPGARFPRKY